MSFPNTFLIKRDDYHAERIGKVPDGTQFFVTTPFRPKRGDDPGAEFLAVFMFEPSGNFRDSMVPYFTYTLRASFLEISNYLEGTYCI